MGEAVAFGADDGSRPPLRRRPGRGENVPPARFLTPLPFDSLRNKNNSPARWAKLLFLERMMGVEPTLPAWEAEVLPMNYIRVYVQYITPKGKIQQKNNERGMGA